MKLEMQVVGTLGAGKVGTALMTRLKQHWETEKLVYHGRLCTTSEVMHVSLHLISRPLSDLEMECPIRAGLCCTARPGLPHSTVKLSLNCAEAFSGHANLDLPLPLPQTPSAPRTWITTASNFAAISTASWPAATWCVSEFGHVDCPTLVRQIFFSARKASRIVIRPLCITEYNQSWPSRRNQYPAVLSAGGGQRTTDTRITWHISLSFTP